MTPLKGAVYEYTLCVIVLIYLGNPYYIIFLRGDTLWKQSFKKSFSTWPSGILQSTVDGNKLTVGKQSKNAVRDETGLGSERTWHCNPFAKKVTGPHDKWVWCNIYELMSEFAPLVYRQRALHSICQGLIGLSGPYSVNQWVHTIGIQHDCWQQQVSWAMMQTVKAECSA